MKKIISLIVALMLLSGIEAKVLLQESFGQGTETLAENDNVINDEIANSGWSNISGSGQVYWNASDLVFAGYKDATDGSGSAEYKATWGQKAGARLSESVNKGSVYVAAILQVDAFTGNSRDYLWALAPDISNLSTAGNHFARLVIQKSGAGFQLGIAKSTESAAFISYTDELDFGIYFVVVEYKFVDGESNDVVRLYLNPSKGDKPAATLVCKQSAKNGSGDEVGSGSKADPASFGSFLLYSSSSAKAAMLIDELRVATAWKNLFGEEGEEEATDDPDPEKPDDPDPEDPDDPDPENPDKPAVGTDLLLNGSFEQYKVSTVPALGEQTSFSDWNWSAAGASADASDKTDGEVSMRVRPTTKNGTLDQGVTLDASDAGDKFELTIHYKAVDLKGGTLRLDCYWEPKPGKDAEAMKAHEAEILQAELTNESGNSWVAKSLVTTMPEGGRYFRVRLTVSAKDADVLFDQFSFVYKGHGDIDPEKPEDPDPEKPEEGEWAHAFVWDESAPLALLIEDFEEVSHNQPLALEGWQNVAPADARPWWGFDEAKTTPARGEGKYAKATAYQFDKESTDEWEMWLVTPALDYKNAASKLFAFKVMGEYLADEGNQAVFEVYYVDPKQPDVLRFQNLTEAFEIPSVSDDNLVWRTFHLDLAPFSATMADVFHMAFRYAGPNGNEGAVTYYIDDVSWGRTDLQGVESIQSSKVESKKVLRDGQLIIIRGEKKYTILGSEL